MLSLHAQLDMALIKILGNSYEEWMRTPNLDFDMKTPIELINQRNYQPIWEFISNRQNEHQNFNQI